MALFSLGRARKSRDHPVHREGLPVMLMGQLPGSGLPFVDIDAVHGSSLAVNHLIDQGHRRIGLITNAALEYTSAQQRGSDT